MAWPRHDPTAVLLGDDRVLVLGDSGGKYEAVPEISRFVELWDPATGRWSQTDHLPKARGSFAAVGLADGRVLVAGGVNDTWYSYSSAYVFDPATERWTKVGLMNAARTEAAAALLPDTRVLVAGGMYYTGVREDEATPGDAILAGVRLADSWPGPEGHALATAELFEPNTGTWTPTGPMRYARANASAVTLADGRVLIVSDGLGDAEQRLGASTPETYDPTTGRFTATDDLPEAVSPSLFDALGVPALHRCQRAEIHETGTVVALADGDALLLDSEWDCSATEAPEVDLALTRSFRLTAATGRWGETGLTRVLAGHDEGDQYVQQAWGSHPDGIVVPLADGQVLYAGGAGADQLGTRIAELFDPVTGGWSPLPDMPGARVTAASVVLADRSVLIAGGYSNPSDGYPIGLGDAFRFIPPR